jgi:hypothetical protein
VIKEDARFTYECMRAKKQRFLLTLTIKNPSLADAGMYRCNAFNPFGDSNANIDLKFESKRNDAKESHIKVEENESRLRQNIYLKSWQKIYW